MKISLIQYLHLIKFATLLLLGAGFGNSVHAATFTVNNTNDSGAGSLRQAIASAEATTGDDIIEFDQSVFNVPRVITLISGVIRITTGGGLVINGTGADLVFVSGNNQNGIFQVSDPVNLTINRMTLFNAATGFDGGAIVNFGTLTINDSIIRNNVAEFDGGGIKNFRNFTLNRSSVIGNSPAGISNENFSATINNSSIRDNFGVGISSNWTLNVNNSTISGNNTGGLYCVSNGGTAVVMDITNSTISGNSRRAGITLDSSSVTLNLISSTVAFNSAMGGGGGVARIGGTINARNSIIARNLNNLIASDVSGTLVSQGYNIIGNTTTTTITGNTTGNQLNVDPLLLPLGDYGGATQTHALQANSPAIDAGDEANVLTADQRGVSRPFDGDGNGTAAVDIGAVEAGILVTNTNDSGAGSLRQALAVSNAAATVDEIRFSTLFDVPQTITLTSGELSIAADRKVFINGSGAEKLIISGNDQSRIFSIISGASATLNNLSLANGRAAFDGGGILNQGELTIEKVIVRDNRSGSSNAGGGIANDSGGMLVVSNSTVRNNSARTGGGIRNFFDAQMIIRNSIIRQNAALGEDGGGITSFGGKTLLSYTTINNNTAANSGGGIANTGNSDKLTLTNCAVYGNTATANGGGIYNSGFLNAGNTTVSGNSAILDGGGIYNAFETTYLMNVTIGGNLSRKGGGVSIIAGTLIARNTISAQNTVTQSSPDFLGTLTSQGYNLIGNTSDTIIAGDSTGNLLNVDPLFLPLADNGGATLTRGLQTNSPAVDAGDPANISAFDQRGFNRASDGNGDGIARADIGAYELGSLVTNTEDSGAGSLRQAISDARFAAGDDEIKFSPLFNTPQTIILTGGALFIGGNGRVVINGNGENLLTISGNNQNRVFSVSSIADLTLNGLTVSGGRINSDGGGIINNGTLRISNSAIANNAGSSGGGTPNGGGAIYNNLGRLTLINSKVINNSLTNGSGGGILNNNGTVNITGSIINNNTASSAEGGGLSNFGGTVVLNDSAVNNNSANRSGGIQNGGTLILNNSTVSGNAGQQLYGGIYNGAILNLNNSTVANNRIVNVSPTTSDGGGIFNLGTITMIGSTISGNTANNGGGIINNGGTNNDRGRLTAINSTISSNRAARQGGAILSVGGVVNLINTTVAFNSANSIGGGVYHAGGANGIFNARNTLISNNIAGSSNSPSDFNGIINSQGYNLIGNTNGATINGTTTGNLLNVESLIDPMLRNNGGATATHALRPNSPAIDAGVSLPDSAVDQRGALRPFDFPNIPNAAGGDGSDIGAFERQATDMARLTFFDFDGDGKSDISVFRPENGSWYIQQSQNGFTGLAFGVASDKLVPADYDGDGRTDVAVYRNGVWYLQRSQLGFTGISFGDGNDVPVPADYDGDGRAELAVFRPSNGYWYILNIANNQFTATLFGISSDKPVPADYDGDGKADIAVNRNGNWYLNRSQLGFTGIAFGDGNDKLVPADYDGDGKSDIAVFRPSNGTWYLLQSSAGFAGIAFGLGTDIPVAADYDGDGKADVAVVRNGNWYLNRSTQGFIGIAFGTNTDLPIPNAFVR